MDQKDNNTFYSDQALIDIIKSRPNLYQPHSRGIPLLIAQIRCKQLQTNQFKKLSDRITRILLEEAFALQPTKNLIKESPVSSYTSNFSCCTEENLVIISILRSGNSFLQEFGQIFPGAGVGQILIQRQEHTEDKLPKLYYEKCPNLEGKFIWIVDPMIATGGSMCQAIEVIIAKGVKEENITVVSIIGCLQGIDIILNRFKQLKIIIAQIDPVLNSNKYLAPGLGDFGDRYFGTN